MKMPLFSENIVLMGSVVGIRKAKLTLLLILSLVLVSFPQIELTKAQDNTVYIRADGTVEGTDKIRIDGNVYTLIEDLSCSIDIMDVFITIEKDNIVFDGDQKTIQGTGNGIGIEARGRINITIQNLRIINFGIGIELRLKDFESKSTASNNQILNNHVDTRYFSMNLNIENGKISENTLISRTHKYGVLFNCNNTVFSNNEFINSGLIIYEPCNGNVFFGNTINSKPVVYLEKTSNQIIDNCVQVFLTDCNNMTIRNINTTADLRITITLFGTKNSKIANCKGNILLRNSDDNNIISNQLEDVDSGVSFNSAAIELSNSNNNIISDNLIHTTGSHGISLIGSSYNNLQGNQIFSSGQAGIIIESTVESLSVFNYINENNISCIENGIYFKGDPRNNVVFKNIIIECKNAIMLSSGHENIFVGNNISRSTQYAVYISRADNNTFYQNNFVENLVSVYEQHQFYYPLPDSYYSQHNLWDNSKEGNYWSNYVGSDSDGDGIGDSPHIVYENKTDNYPLINPVDIKIIPEFPSWTILSLFVTTTLVAIGIRNIIRRRD